VVAIDFVMGRRVTLAVVAVLGVCGGFQMLCRRIDDAVESHAGAVDGLGLLGIPAERNPGYTGVWTRGKKIASIGIHVKQWVTWHGFALNVSTNLEDFDRIVPCGIPGVVMTSVERETGNEKRETLWQESIGAVVKGFESAFGVDPAWKIQESHQAR